MVQVRILAAERRLERRTMTITQTNASLTKGWTASVDGEPERDEPVPGSELPALGERSDAWLVGRARELLTATTTGDFPERQRRPAELDRLLEEAQHRGE